MSLLKLFSLIFWLSAVILVWLMVLGAAGGASGATALIFFIVGGIVCASMLYRRNG